MAANGEKALILEIAFVIGIIVGTAIGAVSTGIYVDFLWSRSAIKSGAGTYTSDEYGSVKWKWNTGGAPQ